MQDMIHGYANTGSERSSSVAKSALVVLGAADEAVGSASCPNTSLKKVESGLL